MSNGEPYHVLVGRILRALEKAKLIDVAGDEINLTKKGKEFARQLVQDGVGGTR
jgi:predicted methyltransferase